MFYYLEKDFNNFKKFSKEMLSIDVELNPYYKDQKQIFIYILNTFSLVYNYLGERSNDANLFEEFSTTSTRFINKAEHITTIDHLTMICKGFLLFCKGDYQNSETYFNSISDNEKSSHNSNVIILATLGKAFTLYNKGNYSNAVACFTVLIRDFDYINETVLEGKNNLKQDLESVILT